MADLYNSVGGEVRCLAPQTTPDPDIPPTLDPGCVIEGIDPALANADNERPTLETVLVTNTLDSCAENVPITIRLTNTSDHAELRDLDADITLPSGVTFIPGTATIEAPDGSINPETPDDSTTEHLIFYNGNTTAPNLPNLQPGETLYIRFNVDIACVSSGQFSVTPTFNDCCDEGLNPGDHGSGHQLAIP